MDVLDGLGPLIRVQGREHKDHSKDVDRMRFDGPRDSCIGRQVPDLAGASFRIKRGVALEAVAVRSVAGRARDCACASLTLTTPTASFE